MIPVTKPYLPEKEEYIKYISDIWTRNWLTNNGPLVNDLELKLKEYLEIDHLLFLNNGTTALQIAIRALDLKGKIITTPFSYVATTSSIIWEGCVPIFVDIDPDTLNINPKLIEQFIDDETCAILATHVYGNPCEIDMIQEIADKHSLKLIFDAAHCFGSKYKNRSVYQYGDISTASFHATKIFHSIEGGAVITKSPEITKKMALLRNFGHISPIDFDGIGINGKNSEFHAAMGLLTLKKIDEILKKRKEQWLYYNEKISKNKLKTIKIDASKTEYNYSYFPIIFQTEAELIKVINELNLHNIYPRRYFFPSLNNLNYVHSSPCPISESVSKRVLCLPLYHDLTIEDQDMIIRIILRSCKYI